MKKSCEIPVKGYVHFPHNWSLYDNLLTVYRGDKDSIFFLLTDREDIALAEKYILSLPNGVLEGWSKFNLLKKLEKAEADVGNKSSVKQYVYSVTLDDNLLKATVVTASTEIHRSYPLDSKESIEKAIEFISEERAKIQNANSIHEQLLKILQPFQPTSVGNLQTSLWCGSIPNIPTGTTDKPKCRK